MPFFIDTIFKTHLALTQKEYCGYMGVFEVVHEAAIIYSEELPIVPIAIAASSCGTRY